MACIIRRARLGDEVNLAYIQTESWKAAFGKILPEDIIQKTTVYIVLKKVGEKVMGLK